MSSSGELLTTFRQKANFMKGWKPASTPSNRDRLELYAWHKQAVSGDAPTTLQTPMTAAEKAKYQAWKSKAGTESGQAMNHYIQESERQIRVYGYSNGTAPSSTPAIEGTETATPGNGGEPQPSRGLSAIPLLCAAASEQRPAYLRRLQNTPITSAWWRRQEPLTATPGSLPAIPESILLWVAATLEHVSLAANNNDAIFGHTLPKAVTAVLQSALWPLHNALLAVWMGWILIASILGAALELSKTVLLGSRRTGRTLDSVWTDEVVFASNAVHTLTESHQPVSARVVGLVMQPLPLLTHVLQTVVQAPLWVAAGYTVAVVVTWWYWMLVMPWFLVVVMLGAACGLGGCFGLIELASQI